ncbi:beta-lactamase/transpeptidase-like protein [Xylariaceae sp. FL0255]|nr:beta-lactamase/transpeptidase-like protein [Xylariaceae sp. FL0255]
MCISLAPSQLSISTILPNTIVPFEKAFKDPTSGALSDNIAWGLVWFSSKENRTLHESYYTASTDCNTTKVGKKYVFRIENLSDKRSNESITKYLASQAAGIPRDATENDYSAEITSLQACGIGASSIEPTTIPMCDIDEIFTYLNNLVFALLSYAHKAITRVSFNVSVADLLEEVGMSRSGDTIAPAHRGVVPGGDAAASLWGVEIEPNVLVAKDGFTAVGAPWEIRYLTLPNSFITTQLTKQGDGGAYATAFVLSRKNALCCIVLAVRDKSASIRESLNEVVPLTNFAGTWVDEATNSSAPLEMPLRSGAELLTSELIGSGTQDSRLGFKATFFNSTEADVIQDPRLDA